MLLSLREGAGSGMVELETPAQAESSQVSGRKMILWLNQDVFAHFPFSFYWYISVLA